ncbi:MAG: hypothetical protein JWO52_7083 [Gammaproteobacteria bacterium]|nr:hypothetical protein [Gammaproteobacteria bacterium]
MAQAAAPARGRCIKVNRGRDAGPSSRHSHTATPKICAVAHKSAGRVTTPLDISSDSWPRTRRCVSVMWRPFLFRRPHCFGYLCRLDSLRERIDPRAQRLNLLALPIYDIAQFDVGTLQERYFRFQPLDCFAVHFDSVTVISGTGAGCMPQQTIETKLEVFLYPGPAGYRFPSVICAIRRPGNACFSSSAAHIKHCNQLPASLGGDVFTCRDRATRVRFRPLVCYGEKRDYG